MKGKTVCYSALKGMNMFSRNDKNAESYPVEEINALVFNPIKTQAMEPLLKMSTFRPNELVEKAKEVVVSLTEKMNDILKQQLVLPLAESQEEEATVFGFKKP